MSPSSVIPAPSGEGPSEGGPRNVISLTTAASITIASRSQAAPHPTRRMACTCSGRTFAGPHTFTKGPGDAFVITRTAGRMRIARSDEFVPRAVRAVDLGHGIVMTGVRAAEDVRVRHVFRDGTLVQTLPRDMDIGYVADVDRDRQILYVSVTLPDGNRGYTAVPYTITGGR